MAFQKNRSFCENEFYRVSFELLVEYALHFVYSQPLHAWPVISPRQLSRSCRNRTVQLFVADFAMFLELFYHGAVIVELPRVQEG